MIKIGFHIKNRMHRGSSLQTTRELGVMEFVEFIFALFVKKNAANLKIRSSVKRSVPLLHRIISEFRELLTCWVISNRVPEKTLISLFIDYS